jgi:hypothetical protein
VRDWSVPSHSPTEFVICIALGHTSRPKILNHRGVSPISLDYALSYVGLGRAYALAGDTAKARTAYQDLFAMWKNADPDIPILKQAKAEYALVHESAADCRRDALSPHHFV